MFELHTERLVLRLFHDADADALHQVVFSDRRVMQFGDGPQSLEWTRAWIQRCQQDYCEARGYGPFAMIAQSTRRLIGYCGLFYFSDVNGRPEVELGYRLARCAWGRGFATEAAIAVRDHAFTSLGMKRLIAIIDPANAASIRVAEKLGMRFESEVMLEGYSHPDHVYSIGNAV